MNGLNVVWSIHSLEYSPTISQNVYKDYKIIHEYNALLRGGGGIKMVHILYFKNNWKERYQNALTGQLGRWDN